MGLLLAQDELKQCLIETGSGCALIGETFFSAAETKCAACS